MKATLAAGPFRRAAPVFRQLRGVLRVVCGYTGGVTPEPTAAQVATGRTGHVEAMQLVYDGAETSYSDLLSTFWTIHDPTAMDFMGAESGAQYRSAIYYDDEAQRKAAHASMAAAQKNHSRPILTLVEPARDFWPVEDGGPQRPVSRDKGDQASRAAR